MPALGKSAPDTAIRNGNAGSESKPRWINELLASLDSRVQVTKASASFLNFAIRFQEAFMARAARQSSDRKRRIRLLLLLTTLLFSPAMPALAADEPDLIFRRSTVFKLLSPNDKLATYGIDDPEVEGVACHFTVPERGGIKGWLGVAEEVSDISLTCSQIGPIHFKGKMGQGDDMFRRRRSLFFKKMQIVRGCDAKRNVLVYMVYSDRLIEGSPKNSTSSVPIMPWGASDTTVQKCGEFIE
jgi:CreA protein